MNAGIHEADKGQNVTASLKEWNKRKEEDTALLSASRLQKIPWGSVTLAMALELVELWCCSSGLPSEGILRCRNI